MSPAGEVCVAFALGREAAPFLRGQQREAVAGAPCRAVRLPCPRVLVLETGVGERSVRRVFDWVAEQRPGLIISAGFAGSLSPDLRVGDVVWPSPVGRGKGAGPTAARGLVTSPALVSTTTAKRALAESTGASLVDMESAHWSDFCVERGIAFAAARAISDGLDDELSPRLVSLLGGSRVSVPRLIAAAIREPRIVPQLWRLARNTSRAADALAAELHSYLRNSAHSASQTSVPSERSF